MILSLRLAAAVTVGSARFPTVTTENLEGKSFTLPRDFGGERNVLFIAFQRQQQRDVDSWVPFARAVVARTPDAEYFEIPTFYRMVAPMQWMLNPGMRARIDDRSARERTLTLYLDKGAFRRALGIVDETQIHILVVDRQGAFLWSETGVFTPAKRESLERRMTGGAG